MRARPSSPTAQILSWVLLVCPHAAYAQFDRTLAGEVAERKIDQLRSDDSMLRAEINSAQIARQAEVTRLEGRILKLEERLRALPRESGNAALAFVLGLATTAGAGQQPEPNIPREDEKASTEETGSTLSESPSAGTRQPAIADGVREIVVRDFMLALEIELLDAQTQLLEKNREVKSLERLSSKGLATAAQLEQQSMQRRRAELQVERFQKQIAGLRRVYPGYFLSPEE